MSEKLTESSDVPKNIPGPHTLTRYIRKKIEKLLIHLNAEERDLLIHLFGLNRRVPRTLERLSKERKIPIESLEIIRQSALSKILGLLSDSIQIPYKISEESEEAYLLHILQEEATPRKEVIQGFLEQQTGYTNAVVDYFRSVTLVGFSVAGNSRLTNTTVSLYILMRKIIAYRYKGIYDHKSKSLTKAHMIEILTDLGFSVPWKGSKKK